MRTSSLANVVANALGPNKIDFAAVAKQTQDEHKPDTRLHLRELPSLEQQRASLTNRIADRKHYIAVHAPIVAELRRRVTNALDELTEVTETAQSGEFQGELQTVIARKKREADKLETTWTHESKALDVAERILTATERNLKEFDKVNGARLKKLRAMDAAIDASRPSTYRSSGDRHEAGLASTY